MSCEAAPDDGFTLVEVLISVAILGIAFVSLLGGIAATVMTSDIHRKQADSHTILVSGGEAVKDQTRNPFKPCATTSSYDPSILVGPTELVNKPGGYTLAVDSVTTWNGTSWVPVNQSSCASGGLTLQKVVVHVTTSDGRGDETLAVVKRKP